MKTTYLKEATMNKAIIIALILMALFFDLWSDETPENSRYVSGNILYMAIDLPLTPDTGGCEVIFPPLGLMASHQIHFPGGFNTTPIVQQPSPAGLWQGGNVYVTFNSLSAPGGINRLYYACIDLGSIIAGPSLINVGNTYSETSPSLAMDEETGNPLAVWHGPGNNTYPYSGVYLSLDQYDLIGIPGLWNTPIEVIANLSPGDEFINPVVKIGPSPTPGLQRIYIAAFNNSPVGTLYHGFNPYLIYADFSDPSDLFPLTEADWTGYEVPYTREWAEQGIRAYSDFTVSADGKVVFTGTLYDQAFYDNPVNEDGYSPNDALFVLVNHNYGEGDSETDWTLHLQDANIPVSNPDNFFTDPDGVPYAYLYLVPFAPRFNAAINEPGDVMFSCIYRLSAGRGDNFFPDQGFVKFIRFLFDTEEFVITDLYPRSENQYAQPYLPWDPEGDGFIYYDIWGNLIMNHSWPVWFRDNSAFEDENYTRLTHSGMNVAVIFQESYTIWGNSNIYLMHSANNGDYWFDPHILSPDPQSSNYFSPLQGMIPAYIYPAPRIEITNNGDWGILHLMFSNLNEYTTGIDDSILIPSAGRLYPNYPNPFNPETTIRFFLTNATEVQLSVYNTKGQLIKHLLADHLPPGEHLTVWNGRDYNEQQVSSGVYFYRLKTPEFSETSKMLLLK